MERLSFNALEKKWQVAWLKTKPQYNTSKKKFYCLEMFPYPSGKIHMGHVRNYTIGDVIARYKTMCGFNVMHPMGWDAFGLPAENAARENNLNPKDWTNKNIKEMKRQLKLLGLSIDWDLEVSTCDPAYYKHQQELFIDFYKKGLVYKKENYVNWDPVEKTVLANEQVINGKGWRSDAVVERKKLSQWFFKITKFSEELINDLGELGGWPEKVKLMQKNWIGRSTGCEINFDVADSKEQIKIYTTRPDTIFGATFIAISSDHSLCKKFEEDNKFINFKKECMKVGTTEEALANAEKFGFNTNLYAKHPFISGKKIPIYVANFVLMDYGTGAIFGCPAHDLRDFEFANKYKIEIIKVIFAKNNEVQTGALQEPFLENGYVNNSDFLNGLSVDEAKEKIIEKVEQIKIGSRKVKYRLKDWGISRQRYWGCPIPMIYLENGEVVPVEKSDLPVLLPEDVDLNSSGNPLSEHKSWKKTIDKKSGRPAIRETDTLDTFVDSSWYFMRFCSPKELNKPFDIEKLNYWLPVDQYVGGIEHAILHLLYSRFFMRALQLNDDKIKIKEPFKNLYTQGMICHETYKNQENKWLSPDEIIKKDNGEVFQLSNNSKVIVGPVEAMSKSKKNTIDPEQMIKKYGADSVRWFVLSDSPPDKDIQWSEVGINNSYKFLQKIWNLVLNINDRKDKKNNNDDKQKFEIKFNNYLNNISVAIDNFQLNVSIANFYSLYKLINDSLTKDLSNDFIKSLIVNYLKILLPFAPHLAHEGMEKIQGKIEYNWPIINKELLEVENIDFAIQINGKTRGILEVSKDISQKLVEVKSKELDKIKKHLVGKKIKKIIFVKNKIINYIVQ